MPGKRDESEDEAKEGKCWGKWVCRIMRRQTSFATSGVAGTHRFVVVVVITVVGVFGQVMYVDE